MLSRAVRESGYKVVLTGEGSDEILAGYPHFRRDMILHHTAGQDPAEVATLMQRAGGANQVSRGLLMPEGETDSGSVCQELLGFVPSWLEAQSGTRPAHAAGSCATTTSRPRAGSDIVGTLLASLDVRAPAEGPERGALGALPLGQDRPAALHPLQPRRPDGDGALDRGAGAVHGSSRRRVSAPGAGVA